MENSKKAGLFYCNPTDPRMFVPRGIGFGWKANYAHKTTWIILLFSAVMIAVAVYAGIFHFPR